ncbi:basic helix-loop-helix protein [Rhizophlyctis rosea]|nr:basic helix-loop-helix protein [Rhizophlyctis rosea]
MSAATETRSDQASSQPVQQVVASKNDLPEQQQHHEEQHTQTQQQQEQQVHSPPRSPQQQVATQSAFAQSQLDQNAQALFAIQAAAAARPDQSIITTAIPSVSLPPTVNAQYVSAYAAAAAAAAAQMQGAQQGGLKPSVGSEEWLRQRRENHKEVERRRRETINDGINDLAKLIPDGEKNKGRVLQRAVQYIHHLKQQDAANMEKWTLEKLLCEQAIQELSAQVDALKNENDQLRAQLNAAGSAAAPTGSQTVSAAPAANQSNATQPSTSFAASATNLHGLQLQHSIENGATGDDGSRKRPREE